MPLSRRVFLASLAGIFLEYFDYTLYGFSAPTIASQFFPSEKPATELLLAWGVFAVSFLVRPFGAAFLGHLADRFGRRHILLFSIILMSFSTIAIGLLPTYHQAGLISPILLLLCRILQGLAVSTEYSGCSTYLLEFIRKKSQGLISGITTSASGFGIFGASLLILSFSSINKDILLLAHWRWPFIVAGATIGLLGFYLRLGLTETPEFLRIQQQNTVARFPLWQLIKKNPLDLIRGSVISAYAGIAIIVIEIYLPSYLQTHLHFDKSKALQLSTYLALVEACLAIGWGAFSDYFGRTRTLFVSGLLMLVGITPLLGLFHLSAPLLWFIAASLLAFIVASIDGPIAAFLTGCFPTEVRYTGVSIAYSLGAAIIGGLSPSLLVLLQEQFQSHNVLSLYLMGSAVIMLLTLLML